MSNEVKLLQAIGLSFLFLGKALEKNKSYQFEYSVGYSIFLLASGWEAARKILEESRKRNSNLIGSLFILFSKLLPIYDLILLIFTILCLRYYTGSSMECAHQNAFLSSIGFLNFDIFYREVLQPKIFNGEIPHSNCDHPFDGYWLGSLLFQSIFILHFIYFISKKLSDSQKNRKNMRLVLLSSLTILSFWGNFWNFKLGRFWLFWAGALLGSVLPYKISMKDESRSQSSLETFTTAASSRILTIRRKTDIIESNSHGSLMKMVKYGSLILILLFFLPFTINRYLAEMLASLATVIILLMSLYQKTRSEFLDSLGKTIGPLMWSVWVIVHPIQFIVTRSNIISSNEEFGVVIPLTLSAGISLHFAFARPLSKMENKQIYYTVAILFILTLSVTVFSSVIIKFLSGNREAAILENSQYLNRRYSLDECMPLGNEKPPRPYGYCEFPEGAGEMRILLVGDLFAATDAPYLFKHFALRYDRFRVFAQRNFHPLKPGQKPSLHRRLMKIIQRFKPMTVIIDQDFAGERAGPPKNKPDDIMIAYRRSISAFLASNVSRVIIAGPRPQPAKGNIEKLEKYLKNAEEVPIEEFTINLVKIRGHSVRRIKNLHEKVTPILLDEYFSKKNNLTFYDPLSYVAYMDDNMALTDLGAQVATRYFERIVDTSLGMNEIELTDEEMEDQLDTNRSNNHKTTKES